MSNLGCSDIILYIWHKIIYKCHTKVIERQNIIIKTQYALQKAASKILDLIHKYTCNKHDIIPIRYIGPI